MKNKKSIFDSLHEKWPSPFVAREKVSEFSGGALNPRTLSNLDSLGSGPKHKIRLGRKVLYPVDSLIEWMKARSMELD